MSNGPSHTVAVVSVAYGSAQVLPGMVESLPAGTPVIIVDNGPDDGLRDWAMARGITVIVPAENLGFGRACNLGAQSATADFVLFLNPDARLDPDALHLLLSAATDFPKASAFAPMLRGDDGHLDFKRRSFLKRADQAPRSPGPDPMAVPSLSGAVLLIRRAAFEAVGGFDPAIFLYYEDDDLAFRLRRDQGPLMLVPAAVAHHASGQSTPPSAALSRFKGYHWARSRVYVARKHGLPHPWFNAMKNALWHMVRPKSLGDPERRSEAIGRLKGAWSARPT
jgi:N-acetylglucosaminyl-diphospho-decaprenol L-rhamnosyltransferase